MRFEWNEKTRRFSLADIQANELELISNAVRQAQLSEAASVMDFIDQPERAALAKRKSMEYRALQFYLSHPKDGSVYEMKPDAKPW